MARRPRLLINKAIVPTEEEEEKGKSIDQKNMENGSFSKHYFHVLTNMHSKICTFVGRVCREDYIRPL